MKRDWKLATLTLCLGLLTGSIATLVFFGCEPQYRGPAADVPLRFRVVPPPPTTENYDICVGVDCNTRKEAEI